MLNIEPGAKIGKKKYILNDSRFLIISKAVSRQMQRKGKVF